VAKEAAKGPAKKKAKSTARKKPAAAKKPKAASAPRSPERNRNALYVLVIMGLLTAMVLLFGKFYAPRLTGSDEKQKESIAVEKKEEKQEKPVGKKEKEERPEKVAHEEKERNQPEKKETPAKQPAESVKIYFVALNEKTDKLYLSPVQRKVGREPLLENTMRELVKGPTAAEKRKGLLTAIPADLKINSIRIRNKTAEIDFNGAIEHDAAGNTLLNRIDQIVYTATQFGSVNSVIIKINGKTRQTLGADGLSISGPIHRRQ